MFRRELGLIEVTGPPHNPRAEGWRLAWRRVDQTCLVQVDHQPNNKRQRTVTVSSGCICRPIVGRKLDSDGAFAELPHHAIIVGSLGSSMDLGDGRGSYPIVLRLPGLRVGCLYCHTCILFNN